MRIVKEDGRGTGGRSACVLSVDRSTPPLQQLCEDRLNLGQQSIVSKTMGRHELPLTVFVKALEIGGNRGIPRIAQRTLQFGEDGGNAADGLASLDHLATLEEGPGENGPFEGTLIQDFDESGRSGGQNPRFQVFVVVVGRCHHSDRFIATLSEDLNHFGVARGPAQEQA